MRRKKEQDFLVKSNICSIIESTEKDRHYLLSELARQSNEVNQLQNGKIFIDHEAYIDVKADQTGN